MTREASRICVALQIVQLNRTNIVSFICVKLLIIISLKIYVPSQKQQPHRTPYLLVTKTFVLEYIIYRHQKIPLMSSTECCVQKS